MAHPFKSDSILSAENKHRGIVGHTKKMEHAYKRAGRLSGVQPSKMEPVPEQGVPQFEQDRSQRDVPYGSIHRLDNKD